MARAGALEENGQHKKTTTSFYVATALAIFLVVDKGGVYISSIQQTVQSNETSSAEFAATSTAADLGFARRMSQDNHASVLQQGVARQSGHEVGGDEEDEVHPHNALFFLVGAILAGTSLLHLTFLRVFKGLQQTVVLFLVGCACSMVLQGLGLREKLGALGSSYNMWMVIDPHLLLFALLPPLLAGDAMSIDTHLARRVANQCLYLAGPGVVASATLTALFLWLYLPYDWPFLLCLTLGAILCATDPVAVVALLKELGASPTLTVQIQGESLLNDGTAIVLYQVTYNMLKGVKYDYGDIMIYLVKTAVYAWVLGSLIGFAFLLWIRAANNKFDHHSSLIQVSLTIACAYSSFIVAEGLFHISGVLSTVAASLVLAHWMWPEVVSRETMHTIWHMLEHLGNTIIFFLAGALTGSIMLRMPFMDYFHLLVIYSALLVIRASLVFLSRPLLKRLHPERQPVPFREAIIMTWGGLRGAVGLALAIQVSINRAGGEVTQNDADRVLFYVGGVALLTLALNATTCPAVVRRLGLAQTAQVKLQLMQMLHIQLSDQLSKRECTKKVKTAIEGLLDDMRHHFDVSHRSGEGDGSMVLAMAKRVSRRTFLDAQEMMGMIGVGTESTIFLPSPSELMKDLERSVEMFKAVPARQRDLLLRRLPSNADMDIVASVTESVLGAALPDVHLLRAVNEAFLSLVRAQYWKQIEQGDLTAKDAEPLIMSVTHALSRPCYHLHDFERICPKAEWAALRRRAPAAAAAAAEAAAAAAASAGAGEETGNLAPRDTARLSASTSGDYNVGPSSLGGNGCSSRMQAVVKSVTFNVLVTLAIVASALMAFHVDAGSSEARYSEAQLVAEIVFTGLFAFESLARMSAFRWAYCRDGWNLFDLLLVLMGVTGILLSAQLASSEDTTHTQQQAQVMRSALVLRKMRAIRLVRMLRVGQVLWATLTGTQHRVECAEHLKTGGILFDFICAHTAAQRELIQFLGRPGRGPCDAFLGAVEVAWCLTMSQTSVHDAMTACAHEEMRVDGWVLEEKDICKESMALAAELEHFVTSARGGGILSSTEAEVLVHTIRHHVQRFAGRIAKLRNGRKTAGPQFTTASEELSGADEDGPRRTILGSVCSVGQADEKFSPVETQINTALTLDAAMVPGTVPRCVE